MESRVQQGELSHPASGQLHGGGGKGSWGAGRGPTLQVNTILATTSQASQLDCHNSSSEEPHFELPILPCSL